MWEARATEPPARPTPCCTACACRVSVGQQKARGSGEGSVPLAKVSLNAFAPSVRCYVISNELCRVERGVKTCRLRKTSGKLWACASWSPSVIARVESESAGGKRTSHYRTSIGGLQVQPGTVGGVPPLSVGLSLPNVLSPACPSTHLPAPSPSLHPVRLYACSELEWNLHHLLPFAPPHAALCRLRSAQTAPPLAGTCQQHLSVTKKAKP